jgi:hypothetical protein
MNIIILNWTIVEVWTWFVPFMTFDPEPYTLACTGHKKPVLHVTSR